MQSTPFLLQVPVHMHSGCQPILPQDHWGRAVAINSIQTDSLETTVAHVIIDGSLVMWPPTTSWALCLKPSILISNTMWHCTKWHPMGALSQSGSILNATLTFFTSFLVLQCQKVLLFLASRASAFSTVWGSSILNFLFLFKCLA